MGNPFKKITHAVEKTVNKVGHALESGAEKVGGFVADTATGGSYSAYKYGKKQRKAVKAQQRKEEEAVRKQRKQALEERKRQIDSQREGMRGDGTSTRGSNKKGIKGTIPEEKLG